MKTPSRLIHLFVNALNFCAPLADLLVRLYVASVFWKSGAVKILNMDSTIWLFTYEHPVPVLPPVCAAYISTYAELIFPVLLVIGLLTRVSAGLLFICNLIAVLAYTTLHAAGVEWHIVWGLLLLVTLLHGPGKLSLDHLIWKYFYDADSRKS